VAINDFLRSDVRIVLACPIETSGMVSVMLFIVGSEMFHEPRDVVE
jgi:hypothetical protein